MNSKQISKLLVLIILSLFLYFGKDQIDQTPIEDTQVSGVTSTTDEGKEYLVTKVVDGDTIKIEGIGTIRLIGIDTPETVDPRKEVQCYGVEASNKAKELLENKYVKLEYDQSQGETDKYGRILAYVYMEDGKMFNELMIEEGFAHEYTYNTPYKYQKEFKELEQYAKDQELGLWGPICNNN